jgi:glycosyltransferase involved in cell wall biosynthesis
MNRPTYSFVVPVHNEEQTLPELVLRLQAVMHRLDGSAEVILVDDGSRDGSAALMRGIQAHDTRFRIIELSRNFGHQLAITAGIDYARGQAVVIMDADLQDPPEVALELAAKWREGYEVVVAVRDERRGESWFKRTTAAMYYRLLRRLASVEIPADAGDYRLVDRKALDAFKALREKDRFVRGMFSWIGFRQAEVRFVRAERFAGETKYPLRRMIDLALDGFLSFSKSPLRLVLKLGFLVSAISFLGGLIAVACKITGVYVVTGWTSMVVAIFFLGGVQLTVMGLIGEYIGRIYEQVKERPLYIVRSVVGFPGESAAEEELTTATLGAGGHFGDVAR